MSIEESSEYADARADVILFESDWWMHDPEVVDLCRRIPGLRSGLSAVRAETGRVDTGNVYALVNDDPQWPADWRSCRRPVHDQLLGDRRSGRGLLGKKPLKPMAFITLGLPGSGKTGVLRQEAWNYYRSTISARDRKRDIEGYPAGAAVLDADEVRGRLPEFQGGIGSAVQSSRSEGTRKTYAAAWRRFTRWCETNGHVTLPAHPITVAAYLVDAADTRTETGERAYAVATFGTWIAAINHQHRTTGHLSSCAHELVTATLSGIRRELRQRGTDPAPRGTRCWSRTSNCLWRRRGNNAKVGQMRSWNAATRRSCYSGSPVRTAAANSPSWCAETSSCIGTTDCTCGCGSRRPTRRAGER